MALSSKKGLISRVRRSKEARTQLVASNLEKSIAYQIRATRDRLGMNQQQLADAVGMSQNNVSRLENPAYGKQTLSSLKRVAEALDVALVVRLVPFSQYVDWLSGTPHLDEGIRPDALAVPNFAEEERIREFEQSREYWSVSITPGVSSGAMEEVTQGIHQRYRQFPARVGGYYSPSFTVGQRAS